MNLDEVQKLMCKPLIPTVIVLMFDIILRYCEQKNESLRRQKVSEVRNTIGSRKIAKIDEAIN